MSVALFPHQQELLDRTWDLPAWAVFYGTGVGKSCPMIHTAARLFGEGKIDGAIVIAPNGVHRAWVEDEIPKHCPVPWRALDWHSSRGKGQDRELEELCRQRAGLPWLAITYDAAITPRGRQAVLDFLARYRRALLVVDESSRVKNPSATRTKKVAALRKLCTYARILNGTPVTQAPTELYAQIKLLDEDFWQRRGIASYTSFRARFCVMKKIVVGGEDDRVDRADAGKLVSTPHVGTREGAAAYEQLDLTGFTALDAPELPPPEQDQESSLPPSKATTGRTIEIVVGYRDLDKLNAMIQPISTRLTKEQAGLNLPPKLYQRLVFEMVPEQRRVYDQLRKEFMVELEGGKLVAANIAMVRITRLQQVACGYLPDPDDPSGETKIAIPGIANPRIAAFRDWLEDNKDPMIVWARFTHDVDQLVQELGPAKCVRYDGLVDEKGKAKALELFRSGKRQVCVAKAASMGVGLTLVNSAISLYYSNTFSLYERLQSEDRQHRPGQHNPVTYVDLIADRSVDGKILTALKAAKSVADEVTGDAYRAWLE